MSDYAYRPSADDGPAAKEPAAPAVPARERALAAYLVLSLVLLAPGVVAATRLRLVFDEAGLPGRWLAALDDAMQRIAFGSTPRFWMGVAGATAMALLLLYPLRKMFGFLRWISVGSWFHLHVVLGLAGPILIAYHCYFGTGSTPANVALFTTMAVAVSGIFGHFIYARISADVHGRRRTARSALDEARSDLGALTATTARERLLDDIANYERSARADARGLLAHVRLARAQRELRRDLLQRSGDLIRVEAESHRWEPDRTRQSIRRVNRLLGDYFAGLAYADRRSLWERLAARWRLLHLPLFYVTVVAASIHVYKVWNMDGAANPATIETDAGATAEPGTDALPPTRGAASLAAGATDGATSAQATASPIATHRVQTVREPLARQSEPRAAAKSPHKLVIPPVMLREGKDTRVAAAAARPAVPDVPPPLPRRKPASHTAHADGPGPTPPGKPPLSGDPRTIASAADDTERRPAAPAPVATLTAPRPPAARPQAAKPVAVAPEKPQQAVRAPELEPLPPPSASPPPATTPSPKLASTPPEPLSPPPMAAGARGVDPVSQLAQQTAKWDNTGRLDPVTVRERLRILKADREFNHDKTRFPLTGKHRRIDCESCHTTTLKDTSRRCINCHRKDDVHRGRRPNCESCHVTTNWGTIRRR